MKDFFEVVFALKRQDSQPDKLDGQHQAEEPDDKRVGNTTTRTATGRRRSVKKRCMGRYKLELAKRAKKSNTGAPQQKNQKKPPGEREHEEGPEDKPGHDSRRCVPQHLHA